MSSDIVGFWMDELAPKQKQPKEEPRTYYTFGYSIDPVPPDQRAVLYRADSCVRYYSAGDSGGVSAMFWAYRVVRYTAFGAWVDVDPRTEVDDAERKLKFVNLRAGKQWASATRDEALYGLMRRRQRQVRILTSQLSSAERQLEYLKELLDED